MGLVGKGYQSKELLRQPAGDQLSPVRRLRQSLQKEAIDGQKPLRHQERMPDKQILHQLVFRRILWEKGAVQRIRITT